MTFRYHFLGWLSLFCFALLSFLVALRFGGVAMTWLQFWHGLSHDSQSIWHVILWQLRLPRVGSAFVVGSSLALAGVLMQALLRNPLADPYILGVSSGASLLVLLCLAIGFNTHLTLIAFIGATASVILVFYLAQMHRHFSSYQLLLVGVIVATACSAAMSFILIITPDRNLHPMLFWLMGDLAYANWSWWLFILFVLAVIAVLCMEKKLDILSTGEQQAASLGINVRLLSWQIYLLSALLTAIAVTLAGNIGFIGLIIPHAARLLFGARHKVVIPASLFLGGTILTLADVGARFLFRPIQLPVGIITAIIGVPVFLILLLRKKTF